MRSGNAKAARRANHGHFTCADQSAALDGGVELLEARRMLSVGPISNLVTSAHAQVLAKPAVVAAGGTISGTVYHDVNSNGQRDNGEPPVAGRQVYLDLNGIGVFASGDPIVTTDAGGHYSFDHLAPANYLVRLVPQNGLAITAPLWGGKFFVQLGQNQTVGGEDFGTIAIASPSFPLPGGQLLVAGFAGGSASLTRYNADGSTDVFFGVRGVLLLPASITSTPSNVVQQPNGQIVVSYASGTVTLSATGAIVSVTPIAGGSISGTVYNDANDNHVRDAGEQPVAGRQVYLDLPGIGVYVSGDPVSVTDANGVYSFTGLAAANYLVRLVPVSGQVVTSPIYGGKYFVQLGTNQQIAGDDFGALTASGLALALPNGQLLVGGRAGAFTVTRYNADGSIDVTFGVRGDASTGIAANFGGIDQLFVRPDGNYVVFLNAATQSSNTQYLVLMDPTGAVLHTVAISTQFPVQLGIDPIQSVAIAADNKVIVSGQHDDPGPSHYKFVRRYNADLTLDTAFGTSGQVTITGAPLPPVALIRPLADGRIVLDYGGPRFLLTAGGVLDTVDPIPG